MDEELRRPRVGGGAGVPRVRGGAGQDLTPGSGTSDFRDARCPWALGVPSSQQAYSEAALPFPLEPLSTSLSSGIMHHTSPSSADLAPAAWALRSGGRRSSGVRLSSAAC